MNANVYVAGHNGMVGSAIIRYLQKMGCQSIITRTRQQLDLRDKSAVRVFFQKEHPEVVFLAAARVGGIHANINYPVQFLVENIEVQVNVIEQAYESGVKRILILGSSCIYPRECPQPMKEEYLLNGPLEPTNEGYALSKIVALKLGEYYHRQFGFQTISIMPPNLYGPNDSFDLKDSHVLSALVRRFIDAKDESRPIVTLWGTGQARREFMHVDDVAEAAIFFIQHGQPGQFINVGWGTDISIKELAFKVAALAGYQGQITWDTSKPDGMMRKCMDVSRMKAHGFVPQIDLDQGILQMIDLYSEMKKKGAII